jgi:hypothetical protein
MNEKSGEHLKRRIWSPIALAFSFRMLSKSCNREVKAGWGEGMQAGDCRDLYVALMKLVDGVKCSCADQRQAPQRIDTREKIFHLASKTELKAHALENLNARAIKPLLLVTQEGPVVRPLRQR